MKSHCQFLSKETSWGEIAIGTMLVETHSESTYSSHPCEAIGEKEKDLHLMPR